MAPTYTTASTKYAIPRIDGSSNVSDVDDGIRAAVDAVDSNMAGYAEGTLAARAGITATAGKLYRTTDTGQLFLGTGSTWIEIGVSPWQPGDLKASWITTAPTGWLLCDGSAVSRATYGPLFAAIGTSAGVGDGSTTFNVPDARARALIMPDGSAARMASNDARGQGGGSERVTLTSAESGLPAHTHPPITTLSFLGSVGASPDALLSLSGGTYGIKSPGNTGANAAADAAASHENMAPYLVVGSVVIKT